MAPIAGGSISSPAVALSLEDSVTSSSTSSSVSICPEGRLRMVLTISSVAGKFDSATTFRVEGATATPQPSSQLILLFKLTLMLTVLLIIVRRQQSVCLLVWHHQYRGLIFIAAAVVR
ncbi:hypothetical protein TYRP_019647 [Tyrophagus putrescentiae]|nr:hypothetical protein TYRP_019647 [Tyrophagus putrescentiae]